MDRVEAALLQGQDLEQERHSKNAVELSISLVSLSSPSSRDPCGAYSIDANVAIPDDKVDGEHGAHELERR
jgi:hypothetical protein